MSDIETNVSKATPKPARRKVQATAIATRSISETGISSLQPIASSSRVEGLPSTPIDRTVGLMAGRTCQVFVEDSSQPGAVPGGFEGDEVAPSYGTRNRSTAGH